MIKPINITDLSQTLEILEDVKQHMLSQGIDQWDETYPNEDIIAHDIHKKQAFIYTENEHILAYMVLNEEYD
ncbi:hypothetical protein [Empedobacter brevis]|uniref:hypothetical protein n=1 Tax=Empedobacter brevis TaxID=247 RepID=UPI00289ABAFE|nr:hypothetical protein [Empedobacter brevis]